MLMRNLFYFFSLIKAIISIQFEMHLRQTTSTSMTLDLEVQKNLLFIPINVGTPPQSFKVVYDTSSFHLWLGNNTLTNRLPKIFQKERSSTFEVTPNVEEVITTNQQGDDVSDLVYLGEDAPKTPKKMNFVLLNQLVSGSWAEGVLGMARNYPGKIKYSKKKYVDSNPRYSLMEYLMVTGQITKKVFAHRYSSKTKATLYIGESGTFKSSIPLCTTDSALNNSRLYHLWNCGTYGFSSLEGTPIDSHTSNIIFDSSRDNIVLPPEIFENLSNYFNAASGGSYCTHKLLKRGTIMSCNQDFPLLGMPDIKVNIIGFNATLKGQDLFELVYEEENNQKNYNYWSKFYSSERMQHMIFGMTFMKYYHMIFDMESGNVGFGDFIDLFIDEEERTNLKMFSSKWSYVKIVLILILTGVILFGVIVYMRRRFSTKRKLIKEFQHEKIIEPIGQPMIPAKD